MKFYLLKDKDVVPTDDLTTWAENMVKGKTKIARSVIHVGSTWRKGEFQDVLISTVFIGMEHTMFETMIFGGKFDGHQVRSRTYDDALRAHNEAYKLALSKD